MNYAVWVVIYRFQTSIKQNTAGPRQDKLKQTGSGCQEHDATGI
jgi:hypothetical protein